MTLQSWIGFVCTLRNIQGNHSDSTNWEQVLYYASFIQPTLLGQTIKENGGWLIPSIFRKQCETDITITNLFISRKENIHFQIANIYVFYKLTRWDNDYKREYLQLCKGRVFECNFPRYPILLQLSPSRDFSSHGQKSTLCFRQSYTSHLLSFPPGIHRRKCIPGRLLSPCMKNRKNRLHFRNNAWNRLKRYQRAKEIAICAEWCPDKRLLRTAVIEIKYICTPEAADKNEMDIQNVYGDKNLDLMLPGSAVKRTRKI